MKSVRKSNGFSLIELLIALAILGIAITAVYSVFEAQQKVYAVQDQVLEMEQTLTACLGIIAKEARFAGLNVKLQDDGRLDSGFAAKIPDSFKPTSPMAVTLSDADYPLKITQGEAGSPDMITIVAAICGEANPLVVTTPCGINSGTTLVDMKTSAGKIKTGDIIYMGRPGIYEYANVTGTSKNRLIIDTDPAKAGNQGVQHGYPEGTEIGEISVITYAIATDTFPWVLKRKVNGGNFQPVGDHIVDLQVTQDGKRTLITLEACTEKNDPYYSENGGYRKARYSVVVVSQNM
jgi:prepilin-type N-terminal cleavage/methylation domain-containing protein